MFDMAQALRRDDAELGQMGAQRIDRRRPLTNKQVARPVIIRTAC